MRLDNEAGTSAKGGHAQTLYCIGGCRLQYDAPTRRGGNGRQPHAEGDAQVGDHLALNP